MDELARQFAETHNEEVTELEALSKRVAPMKKD